MLIQNAFFGPRLPLLLGVALTLAAGLGSGCTKTPLPEPPPLAPSESQTGDQPDSPAAVAGGTGTGDPNRSAVDGEVHLTAISKTEVAGFCADCHAMPRPSSSPKGDWAMEVKQGFTLYATSGRNDLVVPDENAVLEYFVDRAPVELKPPAEILDYDATDTFGDQTEVTSAAGGVAGRPPAVTNVQWSDLGFGGSRALVYSDVGTGAIKAFWPAAPERPVMHIATLLQPVHVESCDLDQDGLTDLIVADIGEFNANDTDLGRVVWLRRVAGEDRFQRVVLAEGLSRVSDVRVADFDSDGDQDLLVAVFGWRNSGEILLYDNVTESGSTELEFESRLVDDRHGTVNLIPTSLNSDEHLDFVALISQEHELVVGFLGDGDGGFTPEILWAAPDPAYGSSGIELVDIDGDGDLDVLYSNGDSFDRGVKPYHSIQWLENAGDLVYRHHHVCKMPGVQVARGGDFDQDGDLDFVAASLVVGSQGDQMASSAFTSVVLLQQTEPGVFIPQQIESGFHRHLSLVSGDFDADGRLDIAVGNFCRGESAEIPQLKIWWNRH